jgi:hypothetical protein
MASPDIEARKQAYRERARAVGIPVFNELHDAAVALAGLRAVEQYRAKAPAAPLATGVGPFAR